MKVAEASAGMLRGRARARSTLAKDAKGKGRRIASRNTEFRISDRRTRGDLRFSVSEVRETQTDGRRRWTDRDESPVNGVVARKQAPSNSVCRENDARSSSPRLRQVYVLPVQGEQALCWVRQPAPRRPASFPRHSSPVEPLSLHPCLSASLGSSVAYPRS